jgi:hypothetical protein
MRPPPNRLTPSGPTPPHHPRFVDDWSDLDAPQNVRIASIPTVFDPSLAPPGKAVGELAQGWPAHGGSRANNHANAASSHAAYGTCCKAATHHIGPERTRLCVAFSCCTEPGPCRVTDVPPPVHAYTAGNEPYSLWEGVRRGSPEYAALKEQRSQCLWKVGRDGLPRACTRTSLRHKAACLLPSAHEEQGRAAAAKF